MFINIDKIAKLLGGEHRLFQAAMRVSVRRAFEKAFPQHAGLSIELNMDGTPSVESVFVEPVGPSQSIRSQCEKNEAERVKLRLRQTQKSQTEVPKTEKYKSNFQVGVRSLRLGPRAAHLLFGGVFGSVMVIVTYTVADKSTGKTSL